MKKVITLIMLGISLMGCTSKEYHDVLDDNDNVKATIAQHTERPKQSKVTYIKKPPVKLERVTQEYDRDWLNEKITVNVANTALSLVLEEVMYGTNVPIYFGEDVSPNKEVTANFSSKRENVLNLIARNTGYGIEVNNNRLEITKNITRIFTINIPTGWVSGQLGSQGNASGEDSVRIEGQYLNVEFDEVKIVDEIAATIKDIIKDDTVTVSPNTTTIIVKTSPDKMQEVERIVDHYKFDLSKQVLLDIQVLEFRSNLGTERGIDWNIVKKVGDGTLQFFVPGTTTLSQGAGYGLAFTGSGDWSGTESFIKVLEKQGSVATQTPVTALVLNNQPAKITQQNFEPFIYEASSESSEGVISASVTRSEEAEGLDMMVSANVQPEHVWLRISGQLQKIVNRRTQKVQQIDLGFLDRQKSEITFVNKLRYGQTFVIASVKQTSSTAEKTKNFFSSLLGGTGTSQDTIETLVLLTPRKVQ